MKIFLLNGEKELKEYFIRKIFKKTKSEKILIFNNKDVLQEKKLEDNLFNATLKYMNFIDDIKKCDILNIEFILLDSVWISNWIDLYLKTPPGQIKDKQFYSNVYNLIRPEVNSCFMHQLHAIRYLHFMLDKFFIFQPLFFQYNKTQEDINIKKRMFLLGMMRDFFNMQMLENKGAIDDLFRKL